ncbi:FIVAR domain-containing protein [Enterococcus sp. ALS3]|uniref:FIVAR domain-containing protein n=1 Tax=Enterococcus alishanensis TaxID=1303817 RepID=A0ABS6T8H5_9ENTE|nr:FIVAR domain-containing protein [Enterococcus alishanensis]MBV7389201.1 FIVAR domain-containing protein [Enterococcus alishanensis]
MKKTILLSLSAVIGLGLAVYGGTDASAASNELYRVYNPNSGEHFYTESASERDGLISQGWTDEGLGWNTPTSGDTVYRIYNSNAGDHHYTKSVDEYNWLASQGWTREGRSFFSSTNEEVAIHRAYNPNAVVGSHNFTKSSSEQNWLVNEQGWTNEGVAFYGVNADTVEVNKDALRAAITSALALNEADYTAESYSQLVIVLNEAQAVLENAEATQAEVNAQVNAVQVAVSALEAVAPAETDKIALEAKITEAKAIEGTDYTAESYQALQDAITAAETVFNNANATQVQVDAQVAALDTAIAGLEENGKVELNRLVNLVQDYTAYDFADQAAFDTFSSALTHAQSVLADANAEQGTIDAALALLSNAESVSVKTALRTALQEAAAKGFVETDFPAKAWADYQTSISDAEALLTKQMTSGQVKNAAAAVNTAVANLESAKFDKTALQALVARVNEIDPQEADFAANYADGTKDAWKTFQTALATATERADVNKVDLENGQGDVSWSVTDLTNAYNSLVYIKDLDSVLDLTSGVSASSFKLDTDAQAFNAKYTEYTNTLAAVKDGSASTTQGNIDGAVNSIKSLITGKLKDGVTEPDFSSLTGKTPLVEA